MTKRQEALLARFEAWLDLNGPATTDEFAIAEHLPVEAARAIVLIGVSYGRFKLAQELIYTRAGFDRLVTELRTALGAEPFPPRSLREMLGVSRQAAEGVANLLEKEGILTRGTGGWRLEERA